LSLLLDTAGPLGRRFLTNSNLHLLIPTEVARHYGMISAHHSE